MRKLPWGVISVVAGAAALSAVFAGCGSENSEAIVDTDSGASSSGGSSGTSGTSSSGGTSGTSSSGGPSGTDGSIPDGAPRDGDIQDGQACALVGQNCTLATASQCCTKICLVAAGQTAGQCGALAPDGGNLCYTANADCTTATQCCSGSCINNKCSTNACKTDSPAEACSSNAECCSGKCDIGGTGKCLALGGATTCRIEGNQCTTNTECCSQQCAGGKCVNVSFCTQLGDVCANDFECCGGNCVKQGTDPLGRCEVIPGDNCTPTGSICTGIGCDNKCCSLSCGPFGTTGVNICQPPSGCRPQNELCAQSADCCGGPGQLKGQKSNGDENEPIECIVPQGESLGRCEGAQCLRPGAACKAATGNCGGTSNNCCESLLPDGGKTPSGFCNSNNEACCSRDALGIPRCRGVNFICTDAGVPAGQICTTSADCCGAPCVNGKCLGTGTCVPKNGECTVTADCCAPEQCVFPPGSTKGICGGTMLADGGVVTTPDAAPTDSGTATDASTDAKVCALYGQTCVINSDCCNGVPCVGGTCRFN